MSGDAMGFLKRDWKERPATDRQAPTRAAVRILGRRTVSTVISALRSQVGSMGKIGESNILTTTGMLTSYRPKTKDQRKQKTKKSSKSNVTTRARRLYARTLRRICWPFGAGWSGICSVFSFIKAGSRSSDSQIKE